MTPTVELLIAQHQEVLARLATVEASLMNNDATDFAEFARFLETDVGPHFALEEQALFPVLVRHLGADHGPLAVMYAEHASFRRLLAALGAAVQAGDAAAQAVHAVELVELLRAHIAKEDHVLFPMAGRILNADEVAEVNERARLLIGAAA